MDSTGGYRHARLFNGMGGSRRWPLVAERGPWVLRRKSAMNRFLRAAQTPIARYPTICNMACFVCLARKALNPLICKPNSPLQILTN